MDNNLKDFLNRHRINILDTNKRAYDHTAMNTKYSIDDMYTATESLRIIPLYTVEITERELSRIAKLEQDVYDTMKEVGHYNIFETMMEIREEEQHLRDTYPAVGKAYDHYVLMLKLAQAGEV